MAFTPFTENDIPSMKTFNEKFQAIMDSTTAINENLIDNGYFGNPVDQRGGYVVPPGTPCFADAGLTTPAPASQTGGYRTVVERAETYCRFQSGNDTWYAAADAAVRGYTGEWKYTIDRWKASGGAVLVTDSGVHLTAAQTQFMQPIETEIANELDGRTVTVSVLDSDGALHAKTYTFTTAFQGFVIDNDFYCQSGLISGQPTILFGAQSRPITMKAAGLELGTQQTLAHQENGVWVLNEIPNYAEELAKCQRYQLVLGDDINWAAVGISQARTTSVLGIVVPIPVELRAVPVVTSAGKIEGRNAENYIQITGFAVDTYGRPANSIILRGSASGLAVGCAYEVYTTPAAKLILDANL